MRKLEQRFGYKCSPGAQECAVPTEAIPSSPLDASRLPEALNGIVKGKAKDILGHVGKLIKQVICMIPIFPCSRKKPSSKEPANDEMSIPEPPGPKDGPTHTSKRGSWF